MQLWWICPDFVWEGVFSFFKDKLNDNGPTVSGFLFGMGWWVWIDAVVFDHVSAWAQFIPGILATFATIIMNLVDKENVSGYDPFDDSDVRRTRFWLLVSYLLSFGAFLGSIIVLISKYALRDGDIYPGVANVIQVSLVLGSGLVFFLSKLKGTDSYLSGL